MFLNQQSPKVLAIGAHPDDIEIGAGGFIDLLIAKHNGYVEFLILTEGVRTTSPDQPYNAGRRREESLEAAGRLAVPREHVTVLNFPDCQLHNYGHQIISAIEAHLYDENGNPRFEVVLTHAADDTHADHRVAHESTLSAVRNFDGTVLCYQAPNTKPNGFHPTFFVKLDPETIARKTHALQAHQSQQAKPFMHAHRTLGLAANWAQFHRLPEDTYLEAFEIYKSFF
jgi:LmbE family N-acetylglucosaminyl deacetylase